MSNNTVSENLTLAELFRLASQKNATKVVADNLDESLASYSSELEVVLEEVFKAWFDTRVTSVEQFQGLSRKRFIR